MLAHHLHCQTLNAHRLVLTDNAGREFVEEVGATIRNPSMKTGDFATRFVAVLRATLLLGQSPLGFD
jgi:hypothetical protein